MMKINNPFTSLRHKNFRYYWFGMCVSTTGTWMQNVAQPWLAYKLTDSALLLSLVSALQFLPMLLFSLFAGVLVDRLPKKKLLLVTQSASLLTTLALATLVWTGDIRYWHLLVASLLLGTINTVDMPTRQSFLIELVEKDDLMNAIALNSAVFNLARTVAPAIAGLVMGAWGIAPCFFINAASFAAVLLSLFFIHPIRRAEPTVKKESVFKNIGEGLKYIYGNKLLLTTLIVMAVVGTFAMNFNVLVPVFAIEVLGQKESGYGLLMSFMGLGAFSGAMLVAAVSKSGPRKFVMYGVPLLIGAAILAIGLTGTYALACAALAIAGFFFVAYSSSANSTMQMNTESPYLGRVMSIYSLVFAGSTPIGNLFAGEIAERTSASTGFIVCGAVIVFLLIPIYSVLLRRVNKPRKNAPGLND